MEYIIQTKPFIQKSISGEKIIHGVRGRLSTDISLLSGGYNDTFYFEFVDEFGFKLDVAGSRRPGIFDKIKEKLINSGVTEKTAISTANSQTDNMYRALSYGTISQKYAAMTAFAASYGLELLPLDQQTGKININK